MNSALAQKEELHATSSIGLDAGPKYRIPNVFLMLFEDAATTATAAFTADPGLYFMNFITAPRIDLTFARKQEGKRFSVATPVVSRLEFESNPIVRVYPATGKHYPMRVVKRSVAVFKPLPVRFFDEEIQSTD